MIERSTLGMIAAPTRRLFLFGAGAALITAPAVVRAASLMDLRGVPLMDLRGVPLRPMLEYIPCDGSEFIEDDHPALFQSFGRRYGGDVERKTFCVPDFHSFNYGLGLDKRLTYEVNKSGELFLSFDSSLATDDIRQKMLSFSSDEKDRLLRGERLKL